MTRTDNFNLYARYYNLLNAEKNYEEEAVYVARLLSLHSEYVRTVLEFGSGTGKHGMLLREMGYDVIGIERSAEMVQMAIKAGFPCIHADISDFQTDNSFDAVISLFHVISYQTENEKLLATFKNAGRHLKTGGLFLFDVWYSPAVYHMKAENRIRRMQNDEIAVVRFAEPKVKTNSNVIDVHFSVVVRDKATNISEEIDEVHSMRHFSVPEIDLLARMCGFEIVRAESFLTGEVPSESTWGVCFVLKKL